MCLSVPGKIIKIKGDKATVDYQGEKREASLVLKKEARVGDFVIVSAKFVMEIVPEDEAKKTIEMWDETDGC